MSSSARRPPSSSYGSTSTSTPASGCQPHVSHVPSPSSKMSPSREVSQAPPHLPRNTSFDRAAPHGPTPLLQPRHTGLGNGNHGYGRGMTFEEIQRGGVLSADERSGDFEEGRLGIGLDEKSIGRMKKKLRPYYTHLAALAEHYREVDALLAGSLPYTVATSFRPSHSQRDSDTDATTKVVIKPIGANDAETRAEADADEEDTESWLRRNSTWKVRKVRRESKKNVEHGHRRGPSADRAGGRRRTVGVSGAAASAGNGHGDGRMEDGVVRVGRERERDVEEVGEGTGLLSEGKEREAKREKLARVALNVNTIVNVVLVAAKVIAVLYSSSISLTASLVDSALDLLSTFIILGTSWAMGIQTDRHKYPAGKRRFEPLGVLIFSVVMIASFVQVFIEAFQRAIEPAEKAPFDLSFVGAMTMVATIGVKTVLWIWCSRIPSSGVQALAQDAENDVMLNIISLSFPSLGTFLGWSLLDPIGGMVLSAYIVFEWIKTLLENFENLSGKSASPDQVTRVLYLVTRFNPVIEIADVECYHIGDDLIVEVDVILPQGSTLHFAHDVGETIQCCIESLEGVLRAYVHVDYSSANPAQHTSRVPGSQLANGAQKRLAPLIESPGSLPNGDGEGMDRGRSPPK